MLKNFWLGKFFKFWVKLEVFKLAVLATVLTLTLIGLMTRESGPTCRGCNVILIVADTLSAEHLSLYGYDRPTSPFIDQFFGQGGLVFKNASSNAPWTIPSFASFFTSQYPSQIFVETISDQLNPEIPSFVEPLRGAGVDLAVFPQGLFQPRQLTDKNGLSTERQFGIIERFKKEEIVRVGDNPLMFRAAGEWVSEHEAKRQEKPFFMLMHSMITHSPYDPPEPYRQLFGGPQVYPGPVTWDDLKRTRERPGGATTEEKDRFRLQYDQLVRYLDDNVKDFIQGLPPQVLKKTIIILIADHGEAFGEHGRLEHGSTLYQEMIGVPWLVHAPFIKPKVTSKPVSLLDLAPTILDIFGLPAEKTFLGRSLAPLFKGGEVSAEVVRSEFAAKRGVRGENEDDDSVVPEVRNKSLPEKGGTAVRKDDWKLIQNPDQSLELYNLKEDPAERTNVISSLAGITDKTRLIIQSLLQILGLEPQR